MGAWVEPLRRGEWMGSGDSHWWSGYCMLQPLIPACGAQARGKPESRDLGASGVKCCTSFSSDVISVRKTFPKRL